MSNKLPLLIDAAANALIALQDAKLFFFHKGIITEKEYKAKGVTNLNSVRQKIQAYDDITYDALVQSMSNGNSFADVSKHISETIQKLVECDQLFDEITPVVQEILDKRTFYEVANSSDRVIPDYVNIKDRK